MDRFVGSEEERTMGNEHQIEKLAALFKQTSEVHHDLGHFAIPLCVIFIG